MVQERKALWSGGVRREDENLCTDWGGGQPQIEADNSSVEAGQQAKSMDTNAFRWGPVVVGGHGSFQMDSFISMNQDARSLAENKAGSRQQRTCVHENIFHWQICTVLGISA